MSKEVYEMITRLDRERIETHLVVQCAPMISGIKISNLFNVEKRLADQMRQVLEQSGISYYLLLDGEDKVTFLVYREDELKAYLMQDCVCRSMRKFGYRNLELAEVLDRFRKRYAECMGQKAEFPHEMGLLLGYPVEDVEGFVLNKGQNYLYCGYWKVYGHVEEKKALFEKYEEARKTLVQFLTKGMNVCEMASMPWKGGMLQAECAV